MGVDLKQAIGKICAVVVTCNRKELLGECLTALLNQTRPLDEVIVIDNASTDGTDRCLREKFPNITHIRLPENIGGAGGWHEGMKLAYDKGYDWIWLMDDDAMPLNDALQKLLTAMEQLPADKIGALLSNVVWSREEVDHTISKGNFEVDVGVFPGWLAPRKAIERVGLCRKDFFIYWEDIEYSGRLRNNGFSLYRVSSSYVIHKDWLAQPQKSINILLRRVSSPIYPNWKSYYLYRNQILMYKSQHRNYELLRTLLVQIPTQLVIRLLIRDTGKIKFILKATIDGLFNRTGKRVSPAAK